MPAVTNSIDPLFSGRTFYPVFAPRNPCLRYVDSLMGEPSSRDLSSVEKVSVVLWLAERLGIVCDSLSWMDLEGRDSWVLAAQWAVGEAVWREGVNEFGVTTHLTGAWGERQVYSIRFNGNGFSVSAESETRWFPQWKDSSLSDGWHPSDTTFWGS